MLTMNYSLFSNIMIELSAAGILMFLKLMYTKFFQKTDNKEKVIFKNLPHSNLTWTPKIVNIIVRCVNLKLNVDQTHQRIIDEISNEEYEIFYEKINKKCVKKNKDTKQTILKRISDLMKEAEEISEFGQQNLNDWVYNRNNARSFKWRSERKKEYAQKNKT